MSLCDFKSISQVPRQHMKDFVSITQLARTLRRHQTSSEEILWQALRNRKLSGKKFLRQHPIVYEELNGKKYFFIADFYCAEHNFVLELDGKIHDYQKDCDKQRDLVLKMKGLKVLHVRNEELQNMELVLKKIKYLL